ncbi:MAG TPA: NAD-dependent epimerase/dehydratase family protein [Patescibacteria group bacterium]|nr:NAD-dependent epimerase/dehydratase family protein [Patescibacteria group bacterium]
MRYKTILITGGAGFIGSNLAVFLKQRYPKTRVIALDNLKRRGSELNLARLKGHGVIFAHGDIRNPEDLALDIREGLLVECSAEPSVLAGYTDNPAYLINTNLVGTVNCLEFARKNRCDVIFLSTSRVYPYAAVNAIKAGQDDTRFRWLASQRIPGWSPAGICAGFTTDGPRTLYGTTKLASEFILQEYAQAYGIKTVVNRCSVVAGPWQFGRLDQGVFALWMLAHYFKRPLRYIGFGAQGKQVRDVLHIDDLCALIDRQIVSLPRISGNTYNVGGGNASSLSLREATGLCERITGNRIRITRTPTQRPGDIRIYITDNRRVSADTGWKVKKAPPAVLNDIFTWIRGHERALTQGMGGGRG